MVKNAFIWKELTLTTKNKVGLLAHIAKIIADHGINIEGIVGYSMDGEANIMIVAENITEAKETLSQSGFSVKESEVLVVDLRNKSGALKSLAAKISEHNIDIKYIYGTVTLEEGISRLVLATSANEKALVILKENR
ncbi:MAG: ACT domain-containing protein [Candidatus Omnitrophica bacterium]|nr:ACT domain-containing protein [Candidatus Omnitrophota bacterium]